MPMASRASTSNRAVSESRAFSALPPHGCSHTRKVSLVTHVGWEGCLPCSLSTSHVAVDVTLMHQKRGGNSSSYALREFMPTLMSCHRVVGNFGAQPPWAQLNTRASQEVEHGLRIATSERRAAIGTEQPRVLVVPTWQPVAALPTCRGFCFN